MIKGTRILLFIFLFTSAFFFEAVEQGSYGEEEKVIEKEEKAKPETPCMPPRISYILPRNAKPGERIRIKGYRFGLVTGKVTINGIPAEVETWRSETIYTKIPDTATSGPVIVNNGCDNSNSFNYTIEPPAQER